MLVFHIFTGDTEKSMSPQNLNLKKKNSLTFREKTYSLSCQELDEELSCRAVKYKVTAKVTALD